MKSSNCVKIIDTFIEKNQVLFEVFGFKNTKQESRDYACKWINDEQTYKEEQKKSVENSEKAKESHRKGGLFGLLQIANANPAATSFKWGDVGIGGVGAMPGKLLAVRDYKTTNITDLPMVFTNTPNTYIPSIIEHALGMFKKDSWIYFFTRNRGQTGQMSWAHKIYSFNVPTIKKQAFGTPHDRISTQSRSLKGRNFFGGIAIDLPFDFTGFGTRSQKLEILKRKFIIAAQCMVDRHSLNALECVMNNSDMWKRYLINKKANTINTNVQEFVKRYELSIFGIINKSPERGLQELIDITKDKITNFSITFDTSIAANNQWGIFVPEEMIKFIVTQPEVYKAIHVNHKGRELFYNQENFVLQPKFKYMNVTIFPIGKYKDDDYKLKLQFLESYRSQIIFNYFDDQNKIQIHDIKQNKKVELKFVDMWDNEFVRSEYFKALKKVVGGKPLNLQNLYDGVDGFMKSYFKDELRIPTNTFDQGVQWSSFDRKGATQKLTALKNALGKFGTDVGSSIIDYDSGASFTLTKTHITLGLYNGVSPPMLSLLPSRELIIRSFSAFMANSHAIGLDHSQEFKAMIKNDKYKTYYLDIDMKFGVTITNDEYFIFIPDIYIVDLTYDGRPCSSVVTEKELKTKMKSSFGKIIPLWIKTKYLPHVKGGFFSVMGYNDEYWETIVNDADVIPGESDVELFDIAGTALEKYTEKYIKEERNHSYHFKKEKPGMIKMGDYAFQAWQMNFCPTTKTYSIEQDQFSNLKYVLNSKKICNTNKN